MIYDDLCENLNRGLTQMCELGVTPRRILINARHKSAILDDLKKIIFVDESKLTFNGVPTEFSNMLPYDTMFYIEPMGEDDNA